MGGYYRRYVDKISTLAQLINFSRSHAKCGTMDIVNFCLDMTSLAVRAIKRAFIVKDAAARLPRLILAMNHNHIISHMPNAFGDMRPALLRSNVFPV